MKNGLQMTMVLPSQAGTEVAFYAAVNGALNEVKNLEGVSLEATCVAATQICCTGEGEAQSNVPAMMVILSGVFPRIKKDRKPGKKKEKDRTPAKGKKGQASSKQMKKSMKKACREATRILMEKLGLGQVEVNFNGNKVETIHI